MESSSNSFLNCEVVFALISLIISAIDKLFTNCKTPIHPTAYAMGFLGCASVKERLGGFPGLKSVVSALPGYTLKPFLNIGNVSNTTDATPWVNGFFEGFVESVVRVFALGCGGGIRTRVSGCMRPARKPLLYPAIYFLICPEYREMLRKEAPPDIFRKEENMKKLLVRPAGLEPATPTLEVSYSAN